MNPGQISLEQSILLRRIWRRDVDKHVFKSTADAVADRPQFCIRDDRAIVQPLLRCTASLVPDYWNRPISLVTAANLHCAESNFVAKWHCQSTIKVIYQDCGYRMDLVVDIKVASN